MRRSYFFAGSYFSLLPKGSKIHDIRPLKQNPTPPKKCFSKKRKRTSHNNFRGDPIFSKAQECFLFCKTNFPLRKGRSYFSAAIKAIGQPPGYKYL